jgi:hypothetical protein
MGAWIVALSAYAAVIGRTLYTGRRSGRREAIAAAVFLIVSLYAAASFVLGRYWPNMDDMFTFMLSEPAQQMLQWLEKR